MSAHTVTITVQPICTCCGSELGVGGLQSKPTGDTFERDTPWLRTEQRVFVAACETCFTFKPEADAEIDRLRSERDLAVGQVEALREQLRQRDTDEAALRSHVAELESDASEREQELRKALDANEALRARVAELEQKVIEALRDTMAKDGA
jgi:septal ring factor EnvC (AmiA/AmiB activator)